MKIQMRLTSLIYLTLLTSPLSRANPMMPPDRCISRRPRLTITAMPYHQPQTIFRPGRQIRDTSLSSPVCSVLPAASLKNLRKRLMPESAPDIQMKTAGRSMPEPLLKRTPAPGEISPDADRKAARPDRSYCRHARLRCEISVHNAG